MKIFKLILRLIAIGLCITLLVLGTLLLIDEATPFTLNYLILCSLGYVVVFHSVIRFSAFMAHRGVSSWILYPLWYIAAFALTPLLLAIDVILHAIGIFALFYDGQARLAERREIREDERRYIYIRSAKRAISKITDEDDRGDIILDDGERMTRFKQVALVSLGGKRYALLSPVSDAAADRKAYAYAIDIYPGTSELSLLPVTNEKLYRRIYEAYEQLLEERI